MHRSVDERPFRLIQQFIREAPQRQAPNTGAVEAGLQAQSFILLIDGKERSMLCQSCCLKWTSVTGPSNWRTGLRLQGRGNWTIHRRRDSVISRRSLESRRSDSGSSPKETTRLKRSRKAGKGPK